MHALGDADVIAAWERGLQRPPVIRALILLALADPQAPGELFAGLPIGRRDARLLALRERLFGPRLAALAHCPHCREPAELDFRVEDVLLPEHDPEPEGYRLQRDGWDVRFRLPGSADLLAAPDPADLLARCILAASEDGQARPAQQVPEEVLDAVVETMSAADPQADIRLALTCPQCGHAWVAHFDVVDYLWREIEYHAGRLLQDVHEIAGCYGWSEAQILALGPQRRRVYLDLIAAGPSRRNL